VCVPPRVASTSMLLLSQSSSFYHPQSGVVLVSVASVCLSVCHVCVCMSVTFESLDVESFFFFCEDIVRGYRSSSYMKVIGSRSRSQQQKAAITPVA